MVGMAAVVAEATPALRQYGPWWHYCRHCCSPRRTRTVLRSREEEEGKNKGLGGNGGIDDGAVGLSTTSFGTCPCAG